MSRKLNAYPFPELIAPDRGWQVWEAPTDLGRINMDDKKMQVPLSQSKRDLAVRAHELGHLKWTPPGKDFQGANRRWCEIVEEMRVNGLLMKEAGVNLDALNYGNLPPPHELTPEEIPLSVAVGFAICMWNLKGHRKHLLALDKQAFRYAEEAHKMLFNHKGLFGKKKLPSFEDTISVARWLESKLEHEPPEVPHTLENQAFMPPSEVSQPKELKIFQPERTEPARDPRLAHRKRTPSEDGSLFIAPHRWCVDRAVFDRHHKTYASTLLIDISSTMRMKQSELIRILNASPMTTIAVYQSDDQYCRLTIVAKNGRRLKWDDVPEASQGGNEGDVHTLAWLTQQPEPRYWISDGGVTTEGHKHSSVNSLNCKRLIQRGRIKQMYNVQHAIDVIDGRRKPLPRPHLTELDFRFEELFG